MTISNLVSFRVLGDMALYSMPEYSVENFTYMMPTPSAIQCMMGNIYVKRTEFEWEVLRIALMKPIRTCTLFTNEINSMPDARKWGPFSVTENRTQRYSTVLLDVEYLVEARPVRTWASTTPGEAPKLQPLRNPKAYVAQFNRHVENGSCFARPYLGVRDFPAFFGPVPEGVKPLPIDMDLGMMPKKVQYRSDDRPTQFFDAKLRQGVMTIPRGAA